MRTDLNRRELEIFRDRSERYPMAKRFKFELGVRLKRAGSYNEAIKQLQQVRNDANRKGLAFLELGECFASAKVKQYKLALTAFETAIESLSARELDDRKKALYFAGKVALHLKNVEQADKHLNELAGLDFNFRDVESLLDKLAQMREDE